MALTKVAPAGIGSTPGDGYRIGSSFLHSTGVELTNANASGIVTAAQFDGKLNIGIATFTDDVKFTGASGNILFDKSQNRLEFDDSVAATFGTAANLRIYGTSSNGQINNYTGDLLIQNDSSSTTEAIKIRGKSGEESIVATADGSVASYYNNVKRLETSGIGVTITGQLDVGNVNSTGVITATKFVGDIAVGSSITYADNEKGYFGTGLDLQLFHDGSQTSYIQSVGASRDLVLKADRFVKIAKTTGGNLGFQMLANDEVGLYHANNKKIHTTSTGVVVTGVCTATSFKLADGSNVGGTDSDAQENTVGGTNAGDTFNGTNALRNTLFGYDAGTDITNADDATAFGHNALGDLTTGARNVAFGSGAGSKLTYSDNNVCIGHNAGAAGGAGNLTGGVNCILIGYEAIASASGASNEITLGNSQITKFRIPGLNYINNDGKVGINEGSPDSWLHVNSGSETVPARFESSGTQSRIGFKAGGTSNTYNVGVGAEAEHLVFYTSNTEKARITSGGFSHLGNPTVTNAWDTHSISLPGANSATFACPATVTIFGGTGYGTANMSGGGIRFVGYYDSSNNFTTFGHVAGVKENTTDGNYAGALTFHTRVNGGLGAERLRITSAGNVGINEASNINGRLHVQHDALAENILYATRYNDQGNDKPILAITEAQLTGMTASGLIIGNHNRPIHIGAVFNSSAAVTTGSATGMTLLSNGKVGIGSVTPARSLSISGGADIALTGSNAGVYMGVNAQGGFQNNCAIARAASNNYHISGSSAGDLCIAGESTKDIIIGTSVSAGAMNERMRFHHDGYITTPNPVAFFAYANMSWTNLNGGDKVQFDTLVSGSWGNNNVNSNGYDTSNDRFVAPVAGLYHFTVAMYINSNNMSNILSIVPRIDGNQLSNGNDTVFFWSARQNGTADGNTWSGSMQLYLNKDQYVEVYRRTGGSGTHQYYGRHSHFFGHLIG